MVVMMMVTTAADSAANAGGASRYAVMCAGLVGAAVGMAASYLIFDILYVLQICLVSGNSGRSGCGASCWLRADASADSCLSRDAAAIR